MELVDELRELVAMLVFLEPEEVTPDTPFSALDIDSLAILEIIAHVEQHVDRLIPEDEIPELGNITEVVQYAHSLSAAA